MEEEQQVAEILAYWFGALNDHGLPREERNKLWFGYSKETDQHIAKHFAALVSRALYGELNHWSKTASGLTALILLLDQFTRNIHRGSAESFAGDELALELAQQAISAGEDKALPAIYRVFLTIPFEHSEVLEVQQAGIRYFDELLRECHREARDEINGFRDYSVAHRDVIARFGRFPHRNAILGRESTAAELAHLEQHGGF